MNSTPVRVLCLLALCFMMSACESGQQTMQGIDTIGDEASTACIEGSERCDNKVTTVDKVNTSLEDLQHHRWVLAKINGQTLSDYAQQLGFEKAAPRFLPELDFGEKGFVAGNTGCNRFNGQASVAENRLTLGPLAGTRMACPGFSGDLEQRLYVIYAKPLAISWQAKLLTLTSDDTSLEFELKDWVQ